jgi:tripartite-type tricarboxylate transporter receptor subunit TctC
VVQSGKERQLALTSDRPLPNMTDLPLLKDTVPGVVMNGLFAIVAPAGTPPDVISKLNRSIDDYLKDLATQDKSLTFGLATGGGGTPESTALAIHAEQEQWLAVAKELGVEPQ